MKVLILFETLWKKKNFFEKKKTISCLEFFYKNCSIFPEKKNEWKNIPFFKRKKELHEIFVKNGISYLCRGNNSECFWRNYLGCCWIYWSKKKEFSVKMFILKEKVLSFFFWRKKLVDSQWLKEKYFSDFWRRNELLIFL